MDALLLTLTNLLDNETHARWIFVGMTAAAVLAFSFGLTYILSGVGTPFRQRVRLLTDTPDNRKAIDRSSMLDSLDPLTDHFMPRKDHETSPVYKKLMHAGFRTKRALRNFYAIKVVLFLALTAVLMLVATFYQALTTRELVLGVLGVIFIALILPSYVLDKLANKRIRTLHNSFPDALDLLIVCVEAGLGLTAALQRVAHELDVNHPELAEELNQVNAEIRAGVHRIDALRAMSERTGVEDIRGLVALLDQSMRFGGSIANTLRVYSEEFRDKRMQKAEELAAKIGTKMIFPLTFCLWPGFFLVAVGPAVLRVLEVFGR